MPNQVVHGPGVPGAIEGDTTAAQYTNVAWETSDKHIHFGTGVGEWHAEARLALSSLPDQYGSLNSGFCDDSTGYGCYFRIDHSTNNWQAVCKDAGGTTSVDTDIAIVTSTDGKTYGDYRTLKVVVNRDGTEAQFFIGTQRVAVITTHIPASTVGMAHVTFNYQNDADSTSHKVWCSFTRLRFDPPPE